MSELHDDRLAALFERALALPPSQREAFLEVACADDPGLRANLASLLGASDDADVYFDDLERRVVAKAFSAIVDSASLEHLQEQLPSRYRIERELSGGGMGRVYLAEDLRLKRRVVIKVPLMDAVPTATGERFQREIELAAQLQHPHVVPVLSADTVDETWYYTMPFVAGESLRDRLSRDGALSVADALRIWRDVLDALAHAHANGVVHRDIKPANILLTERNALVTDFGIAQAMESAAVSVGAPAGPTGTPAYMAPEQVRGGSSADPRIDVYQAGLLMYEMLSGRLPYEAASTREALDARLTWDPAPLSGADIPPGLGELVMGCLAKAPEERPRSAAVLLTLLEELPPSRVRARSRWLPPLAAAAVIAALLFAWTRDGSEPPGAPRYTPSIAAYESYERGMDVALLRSPAGTGDALGYLQRAVELDSMYAAAWAGIARVSVSIWNAAEDEEKPQWLDRAEEAALRALALDESDPEAQAALGWVRLVETDYASAELAFTRALALDPEVSRGREGLARVYMMTGRPLDQLAQAQLAMEADPYSHSAFRELALALAMDGRCEEALSGLEELKRLAPPANVAGVLAGMCYATNHRWDEAIAEFTWSGDLGSSFASPFLAYSLARAGRRDEALAILSELLAGAGDSHGAFGIATVYTGLEDYDQAFAWLAKAVDEGSVNSYVVLPVFADLHRDPRFREIGDRMGVTLTAH